MRRPRAGACRKSCGSAGFVGHNGCDLADGRVILPEVKAAQTYRTDHFAPMRRLAEDLGDRLVAGVVFRLSDHTFHYGEKLWGLPVSALWGHGRASA